MHRAEWKKHKYIEKKARPGYVRYIYKSDDFNSGESARSRGQREHAQRIYSMKDSYKTAYYDKYYYNMLSYEDKLKYADWYIDGVSFDPVNNVFTIASRDTHGNAEEFSAVTTKQGIARILNNVLSSSITNRRMEELNALNTVKEQARKQKRTYVTGTYQSYRDSLTNKTNKKDKLKETFNKGVSSVKKILKIFK